MAEFEKRCIYCKYDTVPYNEFPCRRCNINYDKWEPNSILLNPIRDWLSSFDSSSATQCFTAVNLLKQKLEEIK